MRRDDELLQDILTACRDIENAIAGLDSELAYSVRENRNSVLFSFCVIGEAAGRVSDDLRQRHPEIPWRDIKDFRNVIIHGYFKVDWPLIWEAAVDRVPNVQAAVRRILEKEFPDSRPDTD